MRARCLGALAAGLTIVALGGVASEARAKPGYFVWPGYRENTLSVKGTNGFRITVSHTSRRVELTASEGDAAATYLVPAAKPGLDGEIEARFPGRGRVSVRFHPSGPPHHLPPFDPPGCNGGGEVKQRGTFRGTIRFRGERDFTRVATTSAPGFVFRSIREVCKDTSPNNGSSSDPGYSLSAFAGAQGWAVSFAALRSGPGAEFDDGTTFFGSSFERRRGMKVVRVAIAHAEDEAFAINGPPSRPTTASVAPPVPFHGTAEFDGTVAGRPLWKGTLSVDLPGATAIPLTGASFVSRLCLGQRCRGDSLK